LAPRETLVVETAWDILERYGQRLVRSSSADQQIRLSLQAVQDSLGADAVYWHSLENGETIESLGSVDLSSGWCQTFTEFLRQETPAPRQILRSFLDPAAKLMSPWPCSVVLVQLAPGQSTWLAALSFHPRRMFTALDLKILLLTRRIWLNHRQKEMVDEKLTEALLGMVSCLSTTLEAKDRRTAGHSTRTARIARRLGHQMALPAAFVNDVYLAALLHDIGKVGIREGVLQKVGPLTKEERDHMMEHPVIGDRLLAKMKPLQSLRPGVRGHHERYDGTGYPDRLRGEEIPLAARILAVADALDAMLSDRPYRPALSLERVQQTLLEGAGKQWDPLVIEHLIGCREELFAVANAARS
jgi:HD-GYP domain-containing protein (c-di-GMP phosphodiesterase class II)